MVKSLSRSRARITSYRSKRSKIDLFWLIKKSHNIQNAKISIIIMRNTAKINPSVSLIR